MPTQITPEWLQTVGFKAEGQPYRRAALVWGRFDGEYGITVSFEDGLAADVVIHGRIRTNSARQVIALDSPTQERLRAAWFALTGQHLEHADGDDALAILDAWEEGKPLNGFGHVLPVLRECLAYRNELPRIADRLRAQREQFEDRLKDNDERWQRRTAQLEATTAAIVDARCRQEMLKTPPPIIIQRPHDC
jgi:hypothetical protein